MFDDVHKALPREQCVRGCFVDVVRDLVVCFVVVRELANARLVDILSAGLSAVGGCYVCFGSNSRQYSNYV